jgi:DNA-binding Lrp family transcriptional regulator
MKDAAVSRVIGPTSYAMAQTQNVSLSDPVNQAILAVSEDRLAGFQRDPVAEIARLTGLPAALVIERLRALLKAGVIRRIRQTLLTHNLAEGGLVAWLIPEDRLDAAFDSMSRDDPFTGHVVIRTAEHSGPGTDYRLWTTLKVPREYSPESHCDFLRSRVGALDYRLMPARGVFVLSVGHLRRRDIEPGTRSDALSEVMYPEQADLSDSEWRVLFALKREFRPDEISEDIWRSRWPETGLSEEGFCETAERLAKRNLLGRFSTFLQHSGDSAASQEITRFNALLQWAVPAGEELASGREIARHPVLTHCYWRDAGPDFGNLNIMGVVHGTSKEAVIAHKAAIDRNVTAAGVTITYSNILWGDRAEIKPSEISPVAYREWCARVGLKQSS